MRKSGRGYLIAAVIFGFVIYASVYFYGSRSESFKYVESEIKSSQEIESRIGRVEKVSLAPSGEYREKFFNMKKRATMTVNVVGEKGSIIAKVSVVKVDGKWSLNSIIADDKYIYKNESD